MGPKTVLHPHSKISSTLAPVVLGEGVIIYERAKVGVGMGDTDVDSRRSSVASRTSVRDSMRGEGTVLARNVVVETHAVVEAAEVGEGTVVEVGAYLGRGSTLGRVSSQSAARCIELLKSRQYCTISAHCTVPANTHLPDYTVVYSGSERRTDTTLQTRPEVLEMKAAFHTKQLDTFRKLLPNNLAKWA